MQLSPGKHGEFAVCTVGTFGEHQASRIITDTAVIFGQCELRVLAAHLRMGEPFVRQAVLDTRFERAIDSALRRTGALFNAGAFAV